jgi:hypothetical protein
MNIHNLSIDNQLVMKSTDYCLPDKKVSSNTGFFYAPTSTGLAEGNE